MNPARWIAAGALVLMLAGCGEEAPPIQEPTPALTQAVPAPTVLETVPTVPQTSPTVPQTMQTEPAQPPLAPPEPQDADFVRAADYIPGLLVELRYAGADNFTGQTIYDFQTLWLRYGTVKKLLAVQQTLEPQGLGLKVWDGFRPVSAQWTLWQICPDPTYVADPRTGYSGHSRGDTVDVTLVTLDGAPVEMPTGFDDFTALADRDYADCLQPSADNARLLENAMEAAGFAGYFGEWWHFSDTADYPVEEVFQPIAEEPCTVTALSGAALLSNPDPLSTPLTRLPSGTQLQLLARYDSFAVVEYQGRVGYIDAGAVEGAVDS